MTKIDVNQMSNDFERLVKLKNPDAVNDDVLKRVCLMLHWQVVGQIFPKNYWDISIDEKDLELNNE